MESHGSPDAAHRPIFISHTPDAEKPAVEFADFLEGEGLQPWLPAREVKAGEKWQEAVETALEEAQALVFFIGPESPSTWVRREWSSALQSLWGDEGGKAVVPVVLGDAEVPPFLAGVQALRLSGDTIDRGSFAKIVAQLRRGYEGAGEGSKPDGEDFSALYERVESAISELEREEGDDEVLQGNREAVQGELDVLKGKGELDPEALAVSSKTLGMLDAALGDYAAAKSAFETAINAYGESEAPEQGLASVYNALGRSLMLLGNPEAAAERFEQGLELQAGSKPDSPAAAATLYNLGFALCQSQSYAQAVPVLKRSLDISERTLGVLHPNVMGTTLMLGHALAESGDPDMARSVYGELVAAGEEDEPAGRAAMSFGLGKALRELGDVEQSRQLLDKALRAYMAEYGDADSRVAEAAYQLALTLEEMGRSGEAVELYELALRGAGELNDAQAIIRTSLSLGAALRRAGDFDASVSCFERMLELIEQGGLKSEAEAEARYQLGLSLRDAGDRDRADESLRQAVELGKLVYDSDHPRIGKYERALQRLTVTEPEA